MAKILFNTKSGSRLIVSDVEAKNGHLFGLPHNTPPDLPLEVVGMEITDVSIISDVHFLLSDLEFVGSDNQPVSAFHSILTHP